MPATLKRNPIPLKPEWLKAEVSAHAIGVDRESGTLCGMVIAQEGPFKSEGRGAFDLKGLKMIKALINKEPLGLKSNYGHPNDSGDRASAPGYHLGRITKPFMDVLRLKKNGQEVLTNAVRGDLRFAKTALGFTKRGDEWVFEPTDENSRGLRIMDLAEEDPDALSSSLQVDSKTLEKVEQLDKNGKPLFDASGDPLPPLWYPGALHASDLVNVGDAVDGILSANIDIEQLSRDPVRVATQLLNSVFRDADREVVEARCQAFLKRCLDNRFGEAESNGNQTSYNAKIALEIVNDVKANGLSRDVAELETMLAERGV